MPQLPPAILTHLETDVVILERLVQRSRDQHKSAIFYQSAKHVLKVGKKVVEGVESYKAEIAEGSQDAGQREKKLGKLVKIFATTLLNSARKNSQQIQILYFLPLTTLLQAIYGRLFTLTLSLGPVFGVDAETLCGVSKPPRSTAKTANTNNSVETAAEDFGQRIERVNATHLPKVPDLSTWQESARASRSASSEIETPMERETQRSSVKPSKRSSEEPAGPPRIDKKAKLKTPVETMSLDSIFGEQVSKRKNKKVVDAGEVTKVKKRKKKTADEMEAIFG